MNSPIFVHKNDPVRWHWFAVHDSLTDMAGVLPDDVVSLAASALGGGRVAIVELDI